VKVILIVGHLKFVLIHSVPGALSLGVKRLVCETDHSPPSTAEVKNAWRYTSTFPIRLMTWCSDHYFFISVFISSLLFLLIGKIRHWNETKFPGMLDLARQGTWKVQHWTK